MKSLRRILGATVAVGMFLVLALLLVLWAKPPDLIRIAANYAAKIVCSNVLLAGRDPAAVLAADVQASGHPLFKLMRVAVDPAHGIVRTGLFGFIGNGLAAARPDAGCAVMPDGRLGPPNAFTEPTAPRPTAQGPTAQEPTAQEPTAMSGADPPVSEPGDSPALERVIADDRLAGPGVRAIVVVRGGRFVAERYADGFDRTTPLLGWSMTKSVIAGLIGLLVKDGRLALGQSAGLTGAGRERITIADLMSMTSGLEFNEDYGAVSDATRMLYLEPDMAAFAAGKPVAHPAGVVWSYSSGTAIILSRLFQNAAGVDPLAFVRTRLFGPLGMTSAVIETDESGTWVGSSYMYATPRDWARYGQLLGQDGVWAGQQLLPPAYVAMMTAPVAASGGQYGHGMVWLRVSPVDTSGRTPGTPSALPADTFWMSGHDGQFVAVIPSRQMVIVRMGLTPAREQYRPEPLVHAVLDAALR